MKAAIATMSDAIASHIINRSMLREPLGSSEPWRDTTGWG